MRCALRWAVRGGQHDWRDPGSGRRRSLVVVGQVAQEQERQHVVAEVVGVHRAAQVVGDGPEGFAQLVELVLGHDIASHGLITLRPTALKGATSRVATVKPRAFAMAAM